MKQLLKLSYSNLDQLFTELQKIIMILAFWYVRKFFPNQKIADLKDLVQLESIRNLRTSFVTFSLKLQPSTLKIQIQEKI